MGRNIGPEDSTGLPPTICAQLIVIMEHMHESTGMYLRTINQGPVSWVISQPRGINGEILRCIVLISNEVPEALSIHLSEALLDEFANVYRGRDSRPATQSELCAFVAAVEISVVAAIQRLMFDVLKYPIIDIRAVRTPNTGQALLVSPSGGTKCQGMRSFRLVNGANNGLPAPVLVNLIGHANRVLRAAFRESSFGPCVRVKLSTWNNDKMILLSSVQTPEGPSLACVSVSLNNGDDNLIMSGKEKDKLLKKTANEIRNVESAITAAGAVLASLSQVPLSARPW